MWITVDGKDKSSQIKGKGTIYSFLHGSLAVLVHPSSSFLVLWRFMSKVITDKNLSFSRLDNCYFLCLRGGAPCWSFDKIF